MLPSVFVLGILILRSNERKFSERRFGELAESLKEADPLQELVKKLADDHLKGEDTQQLLKQKIAGQFNNSVDEGIGKVLATTFRIGVEGSPQEDETEITSALGYANAMDEKFQAQIARLSFQQYMSLVIGMCFTIGGAIVLAVLLFDPKEGSSDLSAANLITGYVSRIVTVVFLEIFAFFFLKNYRSIFSEIKYYQHERNVLQGKVVALRIAIAHHKGEGLIEKAFESFLNFGKEQVLSKEATTEALEREKLFQQREGKLYDLAFKALEEVIEKKPSQG